MDSLMRIWHQYHEQSPSAFFTTLDLPQEALAAYFDRAGLPLNEPVMNPWSNEAFISVIRDENFLHAANHYLATNRKLALDYLGSKFADRERIVMVDIGWRGSIQDNLAFIFEQRTFYGFYLGISRYFNDQPKNAHKFAFGPNRNRSYVNFDLLHAVDVMEMISNSSNGSVIAYQACNHYTAKPVRKKRKIEDRIFESFTCNFQKGVLEAARSVEAESLLDSYRSDGLREAALESWRRLLNQPSESMVKAYFSLKHNEEFGLGEFVTKSLSPNLLDVVLSPFSATRRRKIIHDVRFSQWAKGYLRRKDISRADRWLFYLLIKLGLVLKSLKHARPIN